jgi:glycerol-3-phosphate dehydrogenase
MSFGELSVRQRAINIGRQKAEIFDLIVIGGGITGAGVARDGASRGMNVALIEMNDFASGTSSRSSKLIHGGIRYLENLEFKLVFEALSERRRLYSIAPHMVHPLRFQIPLYKDGRVGMFKMGLGMWLYDVLSLFGSQMHERLDATESLKKAPSLRKEGLAGSFIYSDAYMDDDRLVHETLRSAHEHSAAISNFIQAGAADHDGKGRVTGLQVQDRLSGEKYVISGRHIVSSVGPWTDRVAPQLTADWKGWLKTTKGIHLTIDRTRLPIENAVVLATEKDNRIIFVIPRNEMIIVGTTDSLFQGDPAEVKVDARDVDYLLAIVHNYFPGAQLTKKDIIGSYAGVRPLIDDQAETESKTSREEKVETLPAGITFVAGGKYTTYRHMAEKTVRSALKTFSLEDRVRFNKPDTLSPLNPYASIEALAQAKRSAAVWAQNFQRPIKDVEFLAERHGMEALAMLERATDEGYVDVWQIEADQAIRTTMCRTLVDFWFRRVRLFLARRDHGLPFLDSVSSVFANQLGWSPQEMEKQKNELLKSIEGELAWSNEVKLEVSH